MKLDDLMGTPVKKGNRLKQPGEVSARVNRAKILFLYGNGNGRPICDVSNLSYLSGAAPKTITNHLQAWKREAEELARSGGKQGLGCRVTTDDILQQKQRIARLKTELDRLEALLPTLSLASELYQITLRAFNSTMKRWEEASGYDNLVDLQQTIEKEQIKRAARAPGKDDTQERNVSGFNFDAVPVAALPTSREDT